MRELWNARQPLTSEQLRDQWRSYVNGWWGYYRRCEWRRDIYRKEPWIRRHIRKCFWQRWHKSKGRESALRRLGLPPTRPTADSSHRREEQSWSVAHGGKPCHARSPQQPNSETLRVPDAIRPQELRPNGSNRRMRSRMSGGVGGAAGAILPPRPDPAPSWNIATPCGRRSPV